MKKVKLFLIIFFQLCFVCYAQQIELKQLRFKYANKQIITLKKKYEKYRLESENNNNPPAPPSKNSKYNKLVKFYTIPLKQRLKLYPFNIYDSIYITTPKLIKDIDEPRNYLESKYHNKIRQITKSEINKLTDLLFNFTFIYENSQHFRGHNKFGCECIANEYPKIIILFKKNGKFEKYVAYPNEGSH